MKTHDTMKLFLACLVVCFISCETIKYKSHRHRGALPRSLKKYAHPHFKLQPYAMHSRLASNNKKICGSQDGVDQFSGENTRFYTLPEGLIGTDAGIDSKAQKILNIISGNIKGKQTFDQLGTSTKEDLEDETKFGFGGDTQVEPVVDQIYQSAQLGEQKNKNPIVYVKNDILQNKKLMDILLGIINEAHEGTDGEIATIYIKDLGPIIEAQPYGSGQFSSNEDEQAEIYVLKDTVPNKMVDDLRGPIQSNLGSNSWDDLYGITKTQIPANSNSPLGKILCNRYGCRADLLQGMCDCGQNKGYADNVITELDDEYNHDDPYGYENVGTKFDFHKYGLHILPAQNVDVRPKDRLYKQSNLETDYMKPGCQLDSNIRSLFGSQSGANYQIFGKIPIYRGLGMTGALFG